MIEQSRRDFLKAAGLTAFSCLAPQTVLGKKSGSSTPPPNIIIIFCDDLGFGDLSTFGHPTIKTPNLDRMAREGQKWTNFYAAASVCTPSRAGLLTGRLPVRSGMCSDKHRVLFPNSLGGLPENEITIAEALKTRGYATACIGKWHLGHLPQYLPNNNGFDYYFGIPYSNDMDATVRRASAVENLSKVKVEWFNVPLMRNEEIIERPANQKTLTKRYTQEAINFIKQNKDNPFFLYFPHTFPHVPLFASKDFRGKSVRGLYGDVVEELDWSVGQVLKTVREQGLAENTLIVFTSDNGPWLIKQIYGGSAGLLREGKGSTWEGGMREPTIFWWPGKIKPGIVTDMGSTMDLFTTACKLAGAEIPNDRIIDGVDLRPALFGTGKSPRNVMFFYRGTKLYAVRKGQYKAHFITKPAYGGKKQETKHDPPLLYHLGHDPSEKFDIAQDHPEIIKEIKQIVAEHEKNLIRGEDQLAKRKPH